MEYYKDEIKFFHILENLREKFLQKEMVCKIEEIDYAKKNPINNNENDVSLKNEAIMPIEPINNENTYNNINFDTNEKSLQEKLKSIYLTLPSIFPKLNLVC